MKDDLLSNREKQETGAGIEANSTLYLILREFDSERLYKLRATNTVLIVI